MLVILMIATYDFDPYLITNLVMPLACEPGDRGNNRQHNNEDEHHEEECQQARGGKGDNNQCNVRALFPLLQEIIAWLGPQVEEN